MSTLDRAWLLETLKRTAEEIQEKIANANARPAAKDESHGA